MGTLPTVPEYVREHSIVSDLDDQFPVEQHPPLGHVQRPTAYEGFLEEGPSAAFPMDLHQSGLKRAATPIGLCRLAITGVFFMVNANCNLGLQR